MVYRYNTQVILVPVAVFYAWFVPDHQFVIKLIMFDDSYLLISA